MQKRTLKSIAKPMKGLYKHLKEMRYRPEDKLDYTKDVKKLLSTKRIQEMEDSKIPMIEENVKSYFESRQSYEELLKMYNIGEKRDEYEMMKNVANRVGLSIPDKPTPESFN